MYQTTILQTGVVDVLGDALADVVAFLPALIGALLVLIVGWIVGRLLARVVRRVARTVNLDQRLADSPIKTAIGGREDAISRGLGTVTAWYIYLIAALTAANVLAIDTLSEWISQAVSYLPAFVAGLVLILVGFIVVDFVADAIARTETVTSAEYASMFADGVRFFLYFVVIVMGLDTMGVDVDILFLFAQAAAAGVAVGVALAIGIAFGWGGKDYVAENIGGWLGRASEPIEPTGSPQADGGAED